MNITFFEKEPDEIKDFIAQQFKQNHLEETNTTRDPFSFEIIEDNQYVVAGRGAIFGEECYLSELVVHDTHRKKGYGSKTLKEIEVFAKKSNAKTLHVDTYGYQAPEFYEKNGFQEISRIENYRAGYDRIFFRKDIET